jgi:Tat protein translocase TatB subunit
MNILGIGPLELLLILGLALVVFGPERLPELARQAGRIYAELRRVSNEVTGEIQRGLQIDDPPGPTIRPPIAPTYQPPASTQTYTPPPARPASPSAHGDRTDVEPPY